MNISPVDRKGVPFTAEIASANKHDSKLLKPVLKFFRKSKAIRILAADSAWDDKKSRKACIQKNIILIEKFNDPRRWFVERTFGILSWFRGLKICWAKTRSASLAFLQFVCSLRIFKSVGILR